MKKVFVLMKICIDESKTMGWNRIELPSLMKWPKYHHGTWCIWYAVQNVECIVPVK